MLTICHVLPFIIGNKVPENERNWMNALRLIQIIIFSTSTYCSNDTIIFLQTLIAEYLTNFKFLYPKASFIPKMHYMIHLPSQMRAYGPLRHQWCMRFEGKNGYLSNKKYKNFKNLPLTLAKRYQLHIAYNQFGSEQGRSLNYLYSGDQLMDGSESDIRTVYPDLAERFMELSSSQSAVVYTCKSVSIHGKLYKRGCGLVLDYNENDEPQFSILLDIAVVKHVKYFIVEKLHANFCLHILSYVVQRTNMSLSVTIVNCCI